MTKLSGSSVPGVIVEVLRAFRQDNRGEMTKTFGQQKSLNFIGMVSFKRDFFVWYGEI